MQLLIPQWLLPMDNKGTILTNSAVLIDQGLIQAVGPVHELKATYPHASLVHLDNQVLMPGLINMHTHAAMNLLRGAADDLALHDWLQKRIWPLEGALADQEFVFDGTVLACAEMLKSGITTFNDMYFYPEETVRAALAMGMRVVAGITVIEFPTRYAGHADQYIQKGLAARDEFLGEPTVHWSAAPHAPYTVSDDTFTRLRVLAEELDLPIHCHLHETATEVSDALSRDGLRPFQRLDKLGLINERFLAVHGVHLNEPELERMALKGASLVHCPSSNLKLASGFAPTAQALRLGTRLAVGTDGAASNNKLDLWEEARLGSLLAKGHSLDATVWPAYEVLRSMTVFAAQALGMEGCIGQIKPGLNADLISIEIKDKAHQFPVNNMLSKLAYSGHARDVLHVWVQGRQVVESQQLPQKAANLEGEVIRKTQRVWQTRIVQVS